MIHRTDYQLGAVEVIQHPPSLQTSDASDTIGEGSLEDRVGLFERDIIVDALKADGGSLQWSVWQRKLGLGTGEEFALRITDGDGGRVADAIRWLVTSRRNTSLYESLVTRGSLAFREEVA